MELTAAQQARSQMRRGEWTDTTKHTLPGFVKCNLVVLPREHAYDFVAYCQRNPKPCPLVEITDVGDPQPKRCAPGADLRTDLPKYAVYRDGVREQDVTDIRHLWRDDSVGFLIGSGMTWDDALERAGVPKMTTWVFDTTIPTVPAGRFHGPVVVTMRLMTPAHAIIACQLTSRFPHYHGAPLHLGDPAAIGVDLQHPMLGEPLSQIPAGMLPVFWGCGVTPQSAALACKLPLLIAHAPAHAFVTDLLCDQVCIP